MAKVKKEQPVVDDLANLSPQAKVLRFLGRWWVIPAGLALGLGTSMLVSANDKVIETSRVKLQETLKRNEELERKVKNLKEDVSSDTYTQKSDVRTTDVVGISEEIKQAQETIASMIGGEVDKGRYDEAVAVLVKYFGSESRGSLDWLKEKDWKFNLISVAAFEDSVYPVSFEMLDKDEQPTGYVFANYSVKDKLFKDLRVVYVTNTDLIKSIEEAEKKEAEKKAAEAKSGEKVDASSSTETGSSSSTEVSSESSESEVAV